MLGDGSDIDAQNPDGTEGTTKGTLILGKDFDNKARPLKITGQENDELKTSDTNTHLLKEVIKLLKINNQILNEVHDLNVNELDLK